MRWISLEKGKGKMASNFFKKYKFYIIFPFVFFILMTIVLIIVFFVPQKGPFIYQIH